MLYLNRGHLGATRVRLRIQEPRSKTPFPFECTPARPKEMPAHVRTENLGTCRRMILTNPVPNALYTNVTSIVEDQHMFVETFDVSLLPQPFTYTRNKRDKVDLSRHSHHVERSIAPMERRRHSHRIRWQGCTTQGHIGAHYAGKLPTAPTGTRKEKNRKRFG